MTSAALAFDFTLAERAWLAPPEDRTPREAGRLLQQLEAMRREKKRLEAELEDVESMIGEAEDELSDMGYCL